ncbi:MAG: hypoxanthine phosphoribosyltransferase [Eubacteriaceae bacterium]|nr:hypoxanthine phosphoribosyltransferase [Eubacteriaceae bacterium]
MATDTIGTVLYTQEDIWKRAKELGEKITEDYKGKELVLVGTLRGAVMWMADMMRNIDLDMSIDFISASSYGSGTVSSGNVVIKQDVELNVTDKHVLIIEDIIDSGNTLCFLKKHFSQRGAASVKICTMLDKPARREADVYGDYVGYTVDDLFIVGYGLDFDQKYRNLPYITYLEG